MKSSSIVYTRLAYWIWMLCCSKAHPVVRMPKFDRMVISTSCKHYITSIHDILEKVLCHTHHRPCIVGKGQRSISPIASSAHFQLAPPSFQLHAHAANELILAGMQWRKIFFPFPLLAPRSSQSHLSGEPVGTKTAAVNSRWRTGPIPDNTPTFIIQDWSNWGREWRMKRKINGVKVGDKIWSMLI